ncbi:DUF4238 domain-containing protein [Mesorhizobium sp. f-mel]
MDHHFLAQFHLKRWIDTDGRLLRWGRIPATGQVVSKRVAPAATAYSAGLYAIKGVAETKENAIEELILGDIDNRAAPLLAKLIDKGVRSLGAQERRHWARYLNASAARVPHVIAEANSKATIVMERMLSESDSSRLDWVRGDPSGPLVNGGIVAMSRFFSLRRTIERFLSMRWTVREVSGSRMPLMIGDDPLSMTGNLYEAECLVTLPLSPRHLFLATDTPSVAAAINRRSDRELVRAVNGDTLLKAKQFAYGAAERDMIEEYLLISLKK